MSRSGVKFSPAYWKRSYDLKDEDLLAADANLNSQLPNSGPAFAEGDPDRQAVLLEQLSGAAADPLRLWIEQLRVMVNQAQSLEQLRDQLVGAYGDLDSSALANLMELAFGLADAQGREDVSAEAGLL